MDERCDKDLVMASCRGDRPAYADLVRRHYNHVFLVCLGVLGNVHAANIRHVDPNEKVILTVLSQGGGALPPGMPGFGGSAFGGGYAGGGSAGGFSGGSGSFGGGAGGGGFRSESFGYGFGAAGSSQRRGAIPSAAAPATTVLTMQARKADIDAFAKNELDFAQFREKVKTFAY